jgi:hypothetical protein
MTAHAAGCGNLSVGREPTRRHLATVDTSARAKMKSALVVANWYLFGGQGYGNEYTIHHLLE